MGREEIVLAGLQVDPRLLGGLAGQLERVFVGTRVECEAKSFVLPRPTRGRRYSAEVILNSLPAHGRRMLAVVDYDLTVPGMNFVFGLAQPDERRAIIALPRLCEPYYGRPPDHDRFRLRVLTEAVHELGHTYGLGHCRHSGCVMHFSNIVRDTDEKGAAFCPECAQKLPLPNCR